MNYTCPAADRAADELLRLVGLLIVIRIAQAEVAVGRGLSLRDTVCYTDRDKGEGVEKELRGSREAKQSTSMHTTPTKPCSRAAHLASHKSGKNNQSSVYREI